MKSLDSKPQQQYSSKSRDYLLTLSVDGIARTLLWKNGEPLSLEHPTGWTVAKISNTVCFYDASEPDIEKQMTTSIALPAEKKEASFITLPPAARGTRSLPLHVRVVPLVPLQPPYKQLSFDGHTSPHLPVQILMYHGIRYFLLKYRPVGSKHVAKSGENKIFSYFRTPQGCTITALSSNLSIKIKGKKQPLPIGVPQLIVESDFFSSVIIHGIYWWRFRAVLSPDALAPLEEDETEENERETQRFRFATQFVLIALTLLFSGVLTYNFLFPTPPPPKITKIELKAPKVIPHKYAEVRTTPTPRPTPAPTPLPQPPAPEPAPKAVAKKEPPKKEAPKKPKTKVLAKKTPEKKPQPLPVAKKEAPPVAKPAPAPESKPLQSAQKAPQPGVTTQKTAAPSASTQNAQVLKSLSFLSSASKTPRKGGLAKYENSAKKDFMEAPTLGGGTKNSADVLEKISAGGTDTQIKTKSSRTIAVDAGFGSGGGKGLNEVQGKVSLNELYSGGGSGGGFGEGAGVSLSGPGELSEGEIEKALAKHIARFQFCYEKALLSDSTLAGNIRMQWNISTAGRADSAKVLNSQMNNEALHRCIIKVLVDIPFPRPKNGSVTAKKTFSFKSTAL